MLPALGIAGEAGTLLDAAGYIVVLTAIGLETVSDRQMHRFLTGDRQQGKVLDHGLWGVMRRPNYLGEIMFWWGMWLFGISVGPGWWWTVLGPPAMTLMFSLASVPMMEKRLLRRREGYARYMEDVPALLPFRLKRRRD